MVTMAMDTAQKINKRHITIILSLFTLPCFAGEWRLDPHISINETYSDNVELSTSDKTASFVNQTSVGLNAKFDSRLFNFDLQSNGSYASYTHDHDLDDDYRTLSAKAQLQLWTSGPALTASSSIANVSRNSAENSLADLVSADTVERITHQVGLQYNIDNSRFLLGSSIHYATTQLADNIGESHGYSAAIYSRNGSAVHRFMWQINGNYNERKNRALRGENYRIDAKLGLGTPFSISPFVRYYDEDSTGSIAQRNLAFSSWGAGLRWQLSSHLIVDLSYNYPSDKQQSDNYVASSIEWQPSQRTSLTASYDKRFFGDSYQFKFDHTNKRLKNSIAYSETIEAFDRDNYQQSVIGSYWCPLDIDPSSGLAQCFVNPESVIDFDNYQLVTLTDQELIESNEFSLNKNLSWQSTLTLARTTFALNITNRERESLTTNIVQNSVSVGINITRKISGKSELKLAGNFQHQEFNKDSLAVNGQGDYYRTISATYTRKLASALVASTSVQYLDRNSTVLARTYEETRAMITLTKDF